MCVLVFYLSRKWHVKIWTTMEKIVKFNTHSNARDKLCRLLQYTSKFSGWYIQRSGLDLDLVEKFKSLENSFSSTRKVFRLGKSIDLVFGAYNSLLLEDSIIKLALFAAKINQAVYLLADHYVWLVKIGVVNGNAKEWAKTAAKFWLVTIIFNLIRNAYDILNLVLGRRRTKASGEKSAPKAGLAAVLADQPVVIDTVKNCSDLFLALAGIGLVNVNVGLQGVLGMVSSYLALLQIWDARYKLTPA